MTHSIDQCCMNLIRAKWTKFRVCELQQFLKNNLEGERCFGNKNTNFVIFELLPWFHLVFQVCFSREENLKEATLEFQFIIRRTGIKITLEFLKRVCTLILRFATNPHVWLEKQGKRPHAVPFWRLNVRLSSKSNIISWMILELFPLYVWIDCGQLIELVCSKWIKRLCKRSNCRCFSGALLDLHALLIFEFKFQNEVIIHRLSSSK